MIALGERGLALVHQKPLSLIANDQGQGVP